MIQVHADLLRSKVLRDGDRFGQGDPLHILSSKRRREVPDAGRLRIAALQLVFGKDEAPARIALSGHTSSARWLPAVQWDGDRGSAGAFPTWHTGGGQEVTESPVERHRWDHNNSCVASRVPKALEYGQNRRLFRSHIQIMNTRTKRGIDDGARGVEKRPGAIYDRSS